MSSPRSQTAKGAILIMLAGIFWGTIGVLAKSVFLTGTMGALGISFWRGAVAIPILSAFFVLTRRKLPRIGRKAIPLFVAFGLISYSLFQALYMSAFARTTVAHAAALLYVAPIFVAIFSRVLFRERMTVAKIVGVALAIAGAGLVVGLAHGSSVFDSATFAGDMLAIGAGGAYSTWYIFGKLAGQRYDPLTTTFWVMLVGTLALLPPTVILEPSAFAGLRESWYLVLLVALVPTVAAYVTYLHGLRLVEATRASVYATVEPIAAAITAYLIFQETLTIDAFAGVGVILVSIVLVSCPSR